MSRKIKPVPGKEIFLCLLSASLLILAFPNFNIEFFAWVGFVPLFFSLRDKSKGRAFLLSYLTGVIFWSGTIYWLVHVTLPGTILLILYLSLYFGIFGLIVFAYLLSTTYYLLFIPAVWVLLEYIRGHLFTGFPWALLGYSQYLNLPVIQLADITGVWGVSFLVMMVNAAIYSVIGYRLSVPGKIKKSLLPIFCMLAALFYGYYKIYRTPNTPSTSLRAGEHRAPIKISLIQGNIPQELKWDPGAKDYIADKYLDISRLALKDNPDLIVWPEASLPAVPEEEPLYLEKIKGFAKETGAPLLLGAVTSKDGIYYNSALLISKEGQLTGKYDKIHLVPFGEYIPLRKLLPFMETVAPIGDFSDGKEYNVFRLAGDPVSRLASYSRQTGKPANRQTGFSALICFEDLFPELSREFVKKGADFLVNITNDAWFKKTSAPYQHLSASVFRAAENRVFLLRSANTGISAFISPEGRIISRIRDKSGEDSFIEGYNTQGIMISKRPLTFYTRYGDYFIPVCLLSLLVILSVPYAPPRP